MTNRESSRIIAGRIVTESAGEGAHLEDLIVQALDAERAGRWPPRRANVAVPCPECGAQAGASCVFDGGRSMRCHASRDANCAEPVQAPLTGKQLAAKYGFQPHGLEPAQAIDVTCPFCKAPPGQVCRDENDGTPTAHESREPISASVIPRLPDRARRVLLDYARSVRDDVPDGPELAPVRAEMFAAADEIEAFVAACASLEKSQDTEVKR